jgi:hypothetical protein
MMCPEIRPRPLRTAFIRTLPEYPPVQLAEIYTSNSRYEIFEALGNNTGNSVFVDALKSIFDTDVDSLDAITDDKYDRIITTDQLTWMREEHTLAVYSELLKRFKNPIVPISIGLQNTNTKADFKLNPQAVKVLEEMQERCVLGVRGEYTADILAKHGIKNIMVVGCPSMFYHMNRNFRINNSKGPDPRVSLNFRTFGNKPILDKEYDFLLFGAEHNYSFVEQTPWFFLVDKLYGNETDETRPDRIKIRDWMTNKGRVFFSLHDWIDFYKKNIDLSMGGRFHGNVVSVLAGKPSLFITVDSRTTEMADYFHFPTVTSEQFDAFKPISYYQELADYSDFNSNYGRIFDRFINFCNINKLPLRMNAEVLSYDYNSSLTPIGNTRIWSRTADEGITTLRPDGKTPDIWIKWPLNHAMEKYADYILSAKIKYANSSNLLRLFVADESNHRQEIFNSNQLKMDAWHRIYVEFIPEKAFKYLFITSSDFMGERDYITIDYITIKRYKEMGVRKARKKLRENRLKSRIKTVVRSIRHHGYKHTARLILKKVCG